MRVSEQERAKYAEIWALPNYADHSPGAEWAELFGDIVQPHAGERCIDLGCGKGDGGKALAERYGLRMSYLDIVPRDGVIAQSLWQRIPGRWDYGYACDVMEHLPEQFTMLAARNMLDACGGVFFSISFEPDGFGAYIRQPLHLTVQPFGWWRDSLSEIGELVEARDLIGQGVFYVKKRSV